MSRCGDSGGDRDVNWTISRTVDNNFLVHHIVDARRAVVARIAVVIVVVCWWRSHWDDSDAYRTSTFCRGDLRDVFVGCW